MNDIKSIGGFFENGVLKSKETLRKEESQVDKSKRSSQTGSDRASVSQYTTGSALSEVSRRTTEQASRTGDLLHGAERDLKRAKKLTRAEILTARELRAAVKEGAPENEINRLQKSLGRLQKRREALGKQITEHENERSASGNTQVFLGNREIARADLPKVELEPTSDTKNFNEVEDITSFIKSRRSELQTINSQLRSVRGERKEISSAVKSAREELREINKRSNAESTDPVVDFEEADQIAKQVANTILKQGGATVNNLEPQSVNSLLFS